MHYACIRHAALFLCQDSSNNSLREIDNGNTDFLSSDESSRNTIVCAYKIPSRWEKRKLIFTRNTARHELDIGFYAFARFVSIVKDLVGDIGEHKNLRVTKGT